MILRVTAHRQRAVIDWGNPAQLKARDELFILPRPEIYPGPVSIKFVHINLLQWSGSKPEEYPREGHNLMVADGLTGAGFSGSPWVKDGRVYGMLVSQVERHDKLYSLAESATKVHECLAQLHYEELVPTN